LDRKLPPVTVNVVLVREPNPPQGETPVVVMRMQRGAGLVIEKGAT
jgi:hypothetical protein